MFDITNDDSFAKAKSWVKELQRMGNPNMIMSLAGNKADLAEQRAVSNEDAKVSLTATIMFLESQQPFSCVSRALVYNCAQGLCYFP